MLTSNGRWAILSAASAIALGLVFGYPWAVLTGLALAILLAAALVWTLRRPELGAHQYLQPAVVGAGDAAHAMIVVTNEGTTTTAPVRASNLLGGRPVSVDIPRLSPGEVHHADLLLPTDRRGHFEVGPLVIDRADPFGLFRATTHRGGTTSLTVHPAIHPMTTLPTGHRRELEGSTTSRPQEGGISFHSLRSYEPGDDLRLIHWRSVAKTQTLMVRKNILTSEPRLMVVLDTWAGAYDGDSFEDAASIAASLVAAGAESRYPVAFRTTGGLGADIAPSGDGRSDVMRILAGVEPSDADPGLNAVVRFAERVEGISLGAVTGQPTADRTAGITRVRPRFDMVTVVQVGEHFDRPPMRIPGALVINGAGTLDVVERWKGRFG